MIYNGKSAETTSYKLLENTPYVIELTALLRDEFKDIFKKPFDDALVKPMEMAVKALCDQIPIVYYSYCCYDKIYILCDEINSLENNSYFDNDIQAINSFFASGMSLTFNRALESFTNDYYKKNAESSSFDDEEMLYYMKLMQIVKKGTGFLAKTYNVNPHDVIDFFVFRQRELIQRSIEVYGEYYLSLSKEKLKSYGIFEIQNMLEAKGILWEIEPLQYQRGFFYINDDEGNDMQIDREIPIIADNTLYLKGDY